MYILNSDVEATRPIPSSVPPNHIIRNEYTCDVMVFRYGWMVDGAFDGRLPRWVVQHNNIGGKGFARGFYDGGFVEENLYAGHIHTNRQSSANQQCINRKYIFDAAPQQRRINTMLVLPDFWLLLLCLTHAPTLYSIYEIDASSTACRYSIPARWREKLNEVASLFVNKTTYRRWITYR